jgi:hypothetical protein
MGSLFLSARRAGLVWMACVAILTAALGVTSVTAHAQGAGVSHESAAVREELSKQLQQPGPAIVTQGGTGGAGVASPPSGVLVASLATADSDTWKLPRGSLVSRIFAGPINYQGTNGAWRAISDQLVPTALGGYENEANSSIILGQKKIQSVQWKNLKKVSRRRSLSAHE